MTPQYLFRISDGERWTLQDDGKYTMDSSKMDQKYRYSYGELMATGAFTE